MDRFRPEPDAALCLAPSRTWRSAYSERVGLGSIPVREGTDLVVYAGITKTKFGRNRIVEELDANRALFHSDEVLKEVSWDIPIPVLDQEDLNAQGIDTQTMIP